MPLNQRPICAHAHPARNAARRVCCSGQGRFARRRRRLRIAGVNYRGKALREPLAVYWDSRRPLPRYATAFCEMLAAWRAAYWVLGAAVVLIMLPVGLLLYRDRPRSYGVLPDFGGKGVTTGAAKDSIGLTLREAVRARAFWYLASIGFLVNAVGTARLLNHVHALQTAGAERLVAVRLLGVVALSQLLGTLSGGVLALRARVPPARSESTPHEDHRHITVSQCASFLPLLDRPQRRLLGSATRTSMETSFAHQRADIQPQQLNQR